MLNVNGCKWRERCGGRKVAAEKGERGRESESRKEDERNLERWRRMLS